MRGPGASLPSSPARHRMRPSYASHMSKSCGKETPMRVVIAMMKHETNTFSPVPTPIGRFARGAPLPPRGEAALKAYRGTGSAMAAFIDIAEREGWEIITPIAAGASPSAPVEDAAYQAITDAI